MPDPRRPGYIVQPTILRQAREEIEQAFMRRRRRWYRRVWRAARGVYAAGSLEVVCRHPWRRSEREIARGAARLLMTRPPEWAEETPVYVPRTPETIRITPDGIKRGLYWPESHGYFGVVEFYRESDEET